MIKANQKKIKSKLKAVGLLSGGLDSTLAAKVVKDLGVEVHGVYFAMPWGCCDKTHAQKAAEKIGIPFMVLQLDERYLEMVRKPKHGYGRAMNPCVDCRIHMFSRAAQYMKAINGDFVFTGEVLGQRPMSQKRHSMKQIEEATGLTGRLLRPLSAQLLEPTLLETEGLIDRSKLLRFSNRGRGRQMDLAKKLGITDYPNPAGGCLLTDPNFARKMKDTLDYGYRNFRETIALKWGRHFRLNEHFKVIVGRDADENKNIERYAHPDDIILDFIKLDGPTAILKGNNPSFEILQTAAGLMQRFSKYRGQKPIELVYFPVTDRDQSKRILAEHLTEDQIESLKI